MAVDSARSILALIVFLLTNLVGVFSFKVPIPIPTLALVLTARTAVSLRFCHPNTSAGCCVDHPKLLSQSLTPTPSANDDRDEERDHAHEQNGREKFVQWHQFTVGFQTAPLVAVLLLLAVGVLHGREVREGITGTSGIEPLDIMALFISLAYLAISLDTTGLFRFLAFWVVRKGGSSGRKLYAYLYTFFFVSGVFVGNDPVVLFGTPFLAYFARASGIVPPTAWVFAQFIAANTASAVLPSSNLTNLVLTGAFDFSFVSYAAHAVLPTFATALAIYPLLAFVLFKSREEVPHAIDVVGLQSPSSESRPADFPVPPSASSSSDGEGGRLDRGKLRDKHGAIFGSVLLGVTLAVLVGTSPLKIPVWRVTVPPALIMLARDIWHDRRMWGKKEFLGSNAPDEGEGANKRTEAIALEERAVGVTTGASQSNLDIPVAASAEKHAKRRTTPTTLQSMYFSLRKDTLPTVLSILPRLPISLVLFAFCMFILVQALSTWGWVDVFASWWTHWIKACESGGEGGAVVGAVYLMLVVSTFLCNICGTNIGTTILLARVLQTWLSAQENVSEPLSSKVRLGAIYALALGTNFGAYTFSFSASLAGLLWRDILRQKGFEMSQRKFATCNLPVIGLAILVGGAVLIAEVNVVSR